MKRLPYLYFHMKSLNDLQRPPEPVRTFYRLYVAALIVLALGALVIWKAESNYREGLKKPVQVDSERPQGVWEGSKGSTTVSDSGIEITETPRGISFTF